MDIKTIERMGEITQNGKKLAFLPPVSDIETKAILRKAIIANKELAELKNKAEQLPNQDILISSIVLREAKDSSAIENIITTGDVLYKADVLPEYQLDPSTKEVRGYNAALWYGVKLIENHLLSTSVFEAIVQKIKSNTAGIRTTPGTIIKNQNTGEIVHIPPQSEAEIRGYLKNLEDFLYGESYKEIDPLIKLAVMHYQFEAIHPFYDGNGRTGRIANVLWLVQEKLLNRPILFLSAYFLEHRNDYYRNLAGITERGEWEKWILYILDALVETAYKTCRMIDGILNVRRAYSEKLEADLPKIHSFELVQTIFAKPYFRSSEFMKNMSKISEQTAAKYLRLLVDEGFLAVIRQGRENIYINKTLLDVLESE